MNLEGRNLIENPVLTPVDKWIYSRLNSTAKLMEEAFLSYRFNDAAGTIYEFFWNDFCDWYVEATKLSFKSKGNITEKESDCEKDRATTVLLDVLAKSLRLLHPLLSFVTEEIYSKLPNIKTGELLITSPYPEYDESLADTETEKNFTVLQDLVRHVRTLRSECTIAPDRKLRVQVNVREKKHQDFINDNSDLVKTLAGIEQLDIYPQTDISSKSIKKPQGAIALTANLFEVFIFIADAVDMQFLKQKFTKELEKDLKYVNNLKAKLANKDYIKNAPPLLVEGEKLKLEESLKRTGKLESYISNME